MSLEDDVYARTAILATIYMPKADGSAGFPHGVDEKLLFHGFQWVSQLQAIYEIMILRHEFRPDFYEEAQERSRKRVWEHEMAIEGLRAQTPRGAALKMRVALYSMLPNEMIELFLRNDLAAIATSDLDYPVKSMAKILQEIDAMAASFDPQPAQDGEARP